MSMRIEFVWRIRGCMLIRQYIIHVQLVIGFATFPGDHGSAGRVGSRNLEPRATLC